MSDYAQFHKKLGERGKAPKSESKDGSTGKGSFEREWQGTEKNTKNFKENS